VEQQTKIGLSLGLACSSFFRWDLTKKRVGYSWYLVDVSTLDICDVCLL